MQNERLQLCKAQRKQRIDDFKLLDLLLERLDEKQKAPFENIQAQLVHHLVVLTDAQRRWAARALNFCSRELNIKRKAELEATKEQRAQQARLAKCEKAIAQVENKKAGKLRRKAKRDAVEAQVAKSKAVEVVYMRPVAMGDRSPVAPTPAPTPQTEHQPTAQVRPNAKKAARRTKVVKRRERKLDTWADTHGQPGEQAAP